MEAEVYKRNSVLTGQWLALKPWERGRSVELEILRLLHCKWETAVENLSLLPHEGFSQFTHLTRNEWSRKIFMETYVKIKLRGKGHSHQCHWQVGRGRWNRNSRFGQGMLELCRDLLVDDQHVLSLFKSSIPALFLKLRSYCHLQSMGNLPLFQASRRQYRNSWPLSCSFSRGLGLCVRRPRSPWVDFSVVLLAKKSIWGGWLCNPYPPDDTQLGFCLPHAVV